MCSWLSQAKAIQLPNTTAHSPSGLKNQQTEFKMTTEVEYDERNIRMDKTTKWETLILCINYPNPWWNHK